MLKRVLAPALFLLVVAVADAGTLYTVRTSDGMFRRLDTDTLQFTDIGSLGARFDFGGLAWDGRDMYMVQGFAGNGLYRVDLESGATSLVGNHGFREMFGLAYDPTTSTLFGGRSTTGSGLYRLDRGNGSAALVGDPRISLDGLAYDSRRDQLVGGEAGPGDLYSLDRESGAPTLLYDGDFFNNCGMAYDADRDLYWMIDWSGDLYTFDPTKAYARTLVMNVGDSHDGLEWIPEPGTLSLLLLGAALLRRR